MHLSHQEYINRQRQKLADLLLEVLEGRVSMLIASRQVVQLRFEIEFDENDKDILVFVGIDSESDSLPIGPEKIHWSDEALESKKKEIQEVERWALDFGIEACNNLRTKLIKVIT